jgi:hypothetical protein
MTLEETLLQRLAEFRPQSSDRQNLAVSDEEARCSITLSIDRNDDLSCALWEMEQRSRRPLSERGLDLKGWADKVAGQVRGLLEPLRVIEVDDRRAEALIRSDEPTVRKDERYYYELRLNGGGSALVRRYCGTTEVGRRRQVPFTLTHEAVAKLAADLAF